MKKAISILLVVLLTLATSAFADTYELEDILPSIHDFSDEDLSALKEAIIAEENTRNPVQEEQIDAAPIDEPAVADDYVDRPTLQKGSKGSEVTAVQERLIELGFLTGKADGDFGKKSETAVKLFQKANKLEETGIADSMTQYVLFSAGAVDLESFETQPVSTGEGWEMLKEYYYDTSWYHYYIFLLKNTSGYNAKISADVSFFDADNNLVGVSSNTERACENGYVTYWSFTNDMEFDHVTVKITVSEETWYKEGGQSSVDVTANPVGKKAIITATNNGTEVVQFLEYHVLFLDENGSIVNSGWGYLTDDDSELKPGATEMREESCSKGFADVKVYALGRIEKN